MAGTVKLESEGLLQVDGRTSAVGANPSRVSGTRLRSWRAYPFAVQIIFPLICVCAMPPLWYSQHHAVAEIWLRVTAYGWTVTDASVKEESVWSTITDIWNMPYDINHVGIKLPRSWGLLILTFGWSFCYPWVKYFTCLILWFFQCSETDRAWRNVNRVLAMVHWLGKWSYADLFVCMNLAATLAGGDGALYPAPLLNVGLLVYGKTKTNLFIFVIIVATSIFLIWYLRWTRQDPEHALVCTTRKVSLFSWTWEQREQNCALLNTVLLFAMAWLWAIGFVVPFAYHRIHLDDWDFDEAEEWNFWTMRKPIVSQEALYGVYMITVIFIPTTCIATCLLLWMVPFGPAMHSKLRVAYSWMQMFSCPDVFLVCLWAALETDANLFAETIMGAIPPPYGHMLIFDLKFALEGHMLPGVFYPATAAVLLLWFRHYMGRQLRRRLESRKSDSSDVSLEAGKNLLGSPSPKSSEAYTVATTFLESEATVDLRRDRDDPWPEAQEP